MPSLPPLATTSAMLAVSAASVQAAVQVSVSKFTDTDGTCQTAADPTSYELTSGVCNKLTDTTSEKATCVDGQNGQHAVNYVFYSETKDCNAENANGAKDSKDLTTTGEGQETPCQGINNNAFSIKLACDDESEPVATGPGPTLMDMCQIVIKEIDDPNSELPNIRYLCTRVGVAPGGGYGPFWVNDNDFWCFAQDKKHAAEGKNPACYGLTHRVDHDANPIEYYERIAPDLVQLKLSCKAYQNIEGNPPPTTWDCPAEYETMLINVRCGGNRNEPATTISRQDDAATKTIVVEMESWQVCSSQADYHVCGPKDVVVSDLTTTKTVTADGNACVKLEGETYQTLEIKDKYVKIDCHAPTRVSKCVSTYLFERKDTCDFNAEGAAYLQEAHVCNTCFSRNGVWHKINCFEPYTVTFQVCDATCSNCNDEQITGASFMHGDEAKYTNAALTGNCVVFPAAGVGAEPHAVFIEKMFDCETYIIEDYGSDATCDPENLVSKGEVSELECDNYFSVNCISAAPMLYEGEATSVVIRESSDNMCSDSLFSSYTPGECIFRADQKYEKVDCDHKEFEYNMCARVESWFSNDTSACNHDGATQHDYACNSQIDYAFANGTVVSWYVFCDITHGKVKLGDATLTRSNNGGSDCVQAGPQMWRLRDVQPCKTVKVATYTESNCSEDSLSYRQTVASGHCNGRESYVCETSTTLQEDTSYRLRDCDCNTLTAVSPAAGAVGTTVTECGDKLFPGDSCTTVHLGDDESSINNGGTENYSLTVAEQIVCPDPKADNYHTKTCAHFTNYGTPAAGAMYCSKYETLSHESFICEQCLFTYNASESAAPYIYTMYSCDYYKLSVTVRQFAYPQRQTVLNAACLPDASATTTQVVREERTWYLALKGGSNCQRPKDQHLRAFQGFASCDYYEKHTYEQQHRCKSYGNGTAAANHDIGYEYFPQSVCARGGTDGKTIGVTCARSVQDVTPVVMNSLHELALITYSDDVCTTAQDGWNALRHDECEVANDDLPFNFTIRDATLKATCYTGGYCFSEASFPTLEQCQTSGSNGRKPGESGTTTTHVCGVCDAVEVTDGSGKGNNGSTDYRITICDQFRQTVTMYSGCESGCAKVQSCARRRAYTEHYMTCAAVPNAADSENPYGIVHGFFPCDFAKIQMFGDDFCRWEPNRITYRLSGECTDEGNGQEHRLLCQEYDFGLWNDTDDHSHEHEHHEHNEDSDSSKEKDGVKLTTIIGLCIFGCCFLACIVGVVYIFKSRPGSVGGGRFSDDIKENEVELMSLEQQQQQQQEAAAAAAAAAAGNTTAPEEHVQEQPTTVATANEHEGGNDDGNTGGTIDPAAAAAPAAQLTAEQNEDAALL